VALENLRNINALNNNNNNNLSPAPHCGSVNAVIRGGSTQTAEHGCMIRRFVCLSQHVPTAAISKPAAAAGLLLRARPAGDIDRLLQQPRVGGECGQCHVVSIHW